MEVDEVLRNHNGRLTEEASQSLKYLENVIFGKTYSTIDEVGK